MDSFISGQIVSSETHKIIIAIEDEQQCRSCGLKGSCSNKTLTLNRNEVDYPAVNGEKVQVIYKKLLQTSLLLYLFPLLAFFGGIALSAVFLREVSEVLQFMAGFVSLALALISVRLLGKHLSKKEYRIVLKPLM